MNRWASAGVLDRLFEELQHLQLIRVKIEAVSLDITIVKVHPDGTGALKKRRPQTIGKFRGGWTTKNHVVAADTRRALTFSLTPGQAGDAPAGRELLRTLSGLPRRYRPLMARAYERTETRQLPFDLELIPVVPAGVDSPRALDVQQSLVPPSQRNRATVPPPPGPPRHRQPIR